MLSLFGAKKYTLIEAVEKQDFNLVKKLIENGANINEQNKDANTALMLAVMVNSNSTNNFNLSNQHEIIKYLLDKGANIFHKNKYNYNILEIMRGKSHYDDIVKIFNKHSNDVQKPNDISNITSEKVKEENLIKNPNTYKFGASLLYLAILDQNIDKIKMLLKNGADIDLENTKDIPYDDTKLDWLDDRNKTPLYASVKVGNIEIVNLLINHNADINTLLSLSINKNNFEISELLLHKGANPNKNFANSYIKDFPLNTACRNQNLKLVKLLIENGADANFVRDDEQTALFEAISATKANKEIIRFLIANGADIYKEDNNGISPLSFAESNKTSLVKVLTEHEEVELSENKYPNIVANYQNLLEKIVLQNKVITMLKDEINAIKNTGTNHHTKEEFELNINSLKEAISSQSIEIKIFQEKLIEQEQNTKKSIDDLTLKINTLEEKFDKQQVMGVKKPVKFFSNKIDLNKEKNLKEYSSNGDDLVSIKKLESAEYARQIVLKAIAEGHIGMMGGWVSSVALDRLLRLTDNERAIPLNKRRALLEDLGYVYHPNLTDGRVTNGIAIDEGKKPRLYVKVDSTLVQLMHHTEIVQAYIIAQSNASLDNNISKLVASESENINVDNKQYDGIKQNELLNKVNLDNESINQLKEVQDVTKQHLSSEIVSLNQHTEINLTNNKLSVTQEEADKKIQELLSKIESLEKKQPSKPTPLTQPFVERSLVKNDGIIVKRDSLDDF